MKIKINSLWRRKFGGRVLRVLAMEKIQGVLVTVEAAGNGEEKIKVGSSYFIIGERLSDLYYPILNTNDIWAKLNA